MPDKQEEMLLANTWKPDGTLHADVHTAHVRR